MNDPYDCGDGMRKRIAKAQRCDNGIIVRQLQMRVDDLNAERDALQAQLKEARELAERWEDWGRESYWFQSPNEPPTCPWRER